MIDSRSTIEVKWFLLFLKQVWQAEDGMVFDSERDCNKYENNLINEKNKNLSNNNISKKFVGKNLKQELSKRAKLKLFKDNLPLVEIIANTYGPLNKEEYLKVLSEATSELAYMINKAKVDVCFPRIKEYSSGIKQRIENCLDKKFVRRDVKPEFFPRTNQIIVSLDRSAEKSQKPFMKNINELNEEEIKSFVDYLHSYLNNLQAKTIIYRYGITGEKQMSLSAVAEILNLNRDKVIYLEEAAIFILKKLEIYLAFMYERNHFLD